MKWFMVETDAAGFDDMVWATTFVQCCKGNLNESPFYSNYGIPAQQTVLTQIAPDYYVNFMAQQFAAHFASLTVARSTLADGTPVYRVNILTHYGATLTATIPV